MSLTGVSDNAFKGYETITSVNFNSNCSYVGENAFNGCISLVEINRDNEITEIKSGAFVDCSNLSYVDIPYCSDIKSSAFKGCTNLSSIGDFYVDFKVGASAFMNCKNLSNIKLENCISIDKDAFYNCSSITEVTLNKCGCIGESAFMNCTKLERVYITTDSCSLSSSNVFYIFNDQEGVSSINNNVRFLFPADILELYTKVDNSNHWYNYINNMEQINMNKQIIYRTTDDKIIKLFQWINGDSDSDSDSDSDIYNYTDSDGSEDSDGITKFEVGYGIEYGWIYFDKDLISLNDKIFKDSATLESLELPSSCERIGEYEFSGCEYLKSIYIPDTTKLKYIDQFAFQDCKQLSNFTIPNSVESICEGAFAGCESLEKFDGESALLLDDKKIICNNTLICVLPTDNTRIYNISEIDKDITRLGAKCFYGNKNIRRVDIPDSVTSIGDNAFGGCENLCEVHFHCKNLENLPTIGITLFSEKEKNESENNFNPKNENLKIFVPESVYGDLVSNSNSKYHYYKDYIYPMPNDKEIIIYCVDEGNSDEGNSELTQIGYIKINNTSGILTESLWEKAEEIEKDKSHITRVIVGEGVTEIGAFAFKGFTNLKDIYLSDNITALNEGCFYNCGELTRIHIPYGGYGNNSNGLTCGADVFYGCEKLEKFDSYYDGYVSKDGRCYIDDKSSLVFFAQGNLNAGEYTLPDVISIGTSVFKDVFKFDSDSDSDEQTIKITISDKTTSIGSGAFKGCTHISEINLPNNLTRIGDSAFDGCENLNIDESIPKNIKKIGNATFKGCKSIAELKLPENLETIGADAFNGCSNLKISQIPNTVKTIDGGAFKGCTSLGVISLSNNLKAINSDVFYGCTNLITDLPDNLTKIYKNAFYGCAKLNITVLPDKLTRIDTNAFYGCEKLKISQIPNDVTYIGESAFEGCTSLTELYLNNKIKNINNRTFYNCTSLRKVEMSNTIEKIGNYAFCRCESLIELDLSKSNIKTIGKSAFEGCVKYMSDKTFVLPNNLTSLGVACFKSTGVRKIDYRLDESIIIENKYKIPDSIFEDCENLTTVNISILQSNTKKYIEIGKCAFKNCKSLKNLYMIDVSIINEEAFYNCNLSNILDLPSKLVQLGNNCFINTNITMGNLTNKTKLNIRIPDKLSPPKFINDDDKPFGEANLSHLYIDISEGMYYIYSKDDYWKRYKYCMKQPSNDKPVIQPL